MTKDMVSYFNMSNGKMSDFAFFMCIVWVHLVIKLLNVEFEGH